MVVSYATISTKLQWAPGSLVATCWVGQAAGGLTISAAGSGYVNNDEVTLVGGAHPTGGVPIKARVTVGTGGAVTGLTIVEPGQYVFGSAPSTAMSVTAAAGTGLTVTVAWETCLYLAVYNSGTSGSGHVSADFSGTILFVD